jgi:hypothetical protein
VVGGFLDAAALEQCRASVERLRAAPHDLSCVRPHNTLLPLRWCDDVVATALRSQRPLAAVAERVCGTDLRWISGYISIKDARSLPLGWHQDWWCWDHPISFAPRPVQVALLCYLADTDASNGALRVLPGSHVCPTPLHAKLPEAHRAAAEDETASADIDGQVTVEVSAGDAVSSTTACCMARTRTSVPFVVIVCFFRSRRRGATSPTTSVFTSSATRRSHM